MMTIVQRVSEAKVTVDGEVVGAIGPGLLALAAVVKDDTDKDIEWTAAKLAALRIFRHEGKHFDKDVREVGGSILLVSNFTVSAETSSGRRPSLGRAAEPAIAQELFVRLIGAVRRQNVPVETGRFAADMKVSLVNDGPATFFWTARRRNIERMPLPILHDRTPLSREDLLRLYHRTELHWTQQLGTEETLLDVGVAIFNPDFPQVWDANIVFDAALPDGVAPHLAAAEGEEFFRSRGGMCRMWVVNPSLPRDRTQPLADYLVSAGYIKGGYDVLHLGSSPSSPVREIAGLTIIPARASFKHAQELAKVAAKEWGRDQLGDALLMHLEDPQTDGLIALKNGVAVAFVTVLTVGEMGCIENLFVVEPHRRHGIGRTMLSRAMEICARSLFKHVFIGVSSTNVAATSLYKQFGFEKIGEHVYYAIKS